MKQNNFWGEGLKLIQACPLCDTSYNPMEARVVGEKNDSHLVHIQCRKCANAILALVLVSPVGVSSVGVITDLSVEDVIRFRESDEVGLDDAIATHTLLHHDTLFMQAMMGASS